MDIKRQTDKLIQNSNMETKQRKREKETVRQRQSKNERDVNGQKIDRQRDKYENTDQQ